MAKQEFSLKRFTGIATAAVVSVLAIAPLSIAATKEEVGRLTEGSA